MGVPVSAVASNPRFLTGSTIRIDSEALPDTATSGEVSTDVPTEGRSMPMGRLGYLYQMRNSD